MSDENTSPKVVSLPPGRPRINARIETIEAQKRKLALASGWTQRWQDDNVTKAATPTPGETSDRSTQATDDPISQMIESGKVVEPPFDLLTLSLMPEHSAELGQCIDAMEIGVAGWGHRFVPRLNPTGMEAGSELSSEAKKERTKLVNFFEYCSIEDSFSVLQRKGRRDKDTIGSEYYEVIRNAAGEIQGLEHVPAAHVRIGAQEDKPRLVKVPILELQDDGEVKVVEIERWKRHRLYLQSRSLRRSNLSLVEGRRMVWFKDFQDPRVINNETGEEVTEAQKIEALRAQGKLANELIHLRYYNSRTVYGLPKYIGNLLSIFGDRAAEEINFITFRNNNIPSMAIMVSNGQLTDGTVKRIESFVESQIQGSDNYSKFLIIEAETFEEGEDGGHLKVDIKPLTSHQLHDAMFQKYSQNNRDSIRRSFRLPPILVGRSDDYTRSTAETSRKLADEQVFAPERDVFDDFVNRRLFPAMGIRFWKYKSNSPNTTDNQELVKILSDAEKTGGMTPNIAREVISDVLGKELPPVPEDFPGDVPFSYTMAEAVKNKADPTQPGQQFTAIKMIQALTGDDKPATTPEEIAQAGESALATILKARRAVEAAWAAAASGEDMSAGE